MNTKEPIRAQSKLDLANAYKISYKTLSSWLEPLQKELGEYRGKSFNPRQVSIIYQRFGRPI